MASEQNKPSTVQKSYPAKLEEYVNGKVAQNRKGGRPHLLSVLAKAGRDPKEEVLNIIEQRWIKDRSPSLIAKDFDTLSRNISRLLDDVKGLDPTMKEEVVAYIRTSPRRKRWYIPEMDTSDYESVQNYIRRARRDGLKRYKDGINRARKVWIFMN